MVEIMERCRKIIAKKHRYVFAFVAMLLLVLLVIPITTPIMAHTPSNQVPPLSLTQAATSQEVPTQAIPTNANILVDGKPISFQAYNIGGNNFFMLRDLAYTLSGTPAQFDIGWDGYTNSILITRGIPYTIVGGEMNINPYVQSTTPAVTAVMPTTSNIILAGVGRISPRGYLIGNNNFFMLRELGVLLDFGVDWDEDARTILITTTPPISDSNANNNSFGNAGSNDFGNSNAGNSSVGSGNDRDNRSGRGSRLDAIIAEIHTCENGLLHPTNEQLLLWIELASTMAETRSSITLPSRRPTSSEIQSWSNEYAALGGINAFELEVIRLVNEIRVRYGLNPLAICVKLSMAARFHSQSMVDLNFFGHGNPHYSCVVTNRYQSSGSDRAQMFGHDNIQEGFYGVGENVSGGTGTPQQRVDGWMNSPGHRAAILRTHSLAVGVGATEMEHQVPGQQHGATTIKFGS